MTLETNRRTRSSENAGAGQHPAVSRGLIILPEPLRKILNGSKTWEIRSRATAVRGPVALIESGSGMGYRHLHDRRLRRSADARRKPAQRSASRLSTR